MTAECDGYHVSVVKPCQVKLYFYKVSYLMLWYGKQHEAQVLKYQYAPLCNITLYVCEHDSAHLNVEDSAVILWCNM